VSETKSGGEDWRDRATALTEHGGVPPQRARAVALREQGRTYAEIADELGLESRSSVRKQVEAYEQSYREAEWLVKHGPEPSVGVED